MIELVRKEIELGQYLVNNGIVTRFFHSAELFNDKERGNLYPVIRVGDEFTYIGVDDTRSRFAYIRLTGDPTASGVPLAIKGCSKSYNVICPVRLVVFNDWESEIREQLINKILAVTFFHHVSLIRYSANAGQLSREESPIGEFEFGGKTFYLAIDLNIVIPLMSNSCDEICDPFPNPICS